MLSGSLFPSSIVNSSSSLGTKIGSKISSAWSGLKDWVYSLTPSGQEDRSKRIAQYEANLQQESLDKQMSYNAEQAELDREFQLTSAEKSAALNEESAINAYNRQRELTEDQYSLMVSGMKKAGLNPALMYQSMGSTPTVASASSNFASGSKSSSSGHASTSAASTLLSQYISQNGQNYRTYVNNLHDAYQQSQNRVYSLAESVLDFFS